MAMNPMQRRARNSFLIGFLMALVIMAIVVILLVRKIQGLNDKYDKIIALQTQTLVAAEDIQSGEEVTLDSFSMETVQTTVDLKKVITELDFEYQDEKTGEIVEKYDKDGNPVKKKMVMKTDIPAGTIVTKDMLEATEERTTADQRMQEYNMIILPTLLKNNDYIDIRLQLPEGEDYIVVSKKKVIYTTADTVWLNMSEDEILTLGNAIVEAYTIVGSKLYATTYTEAGRQTAATPTYPVNQAVLTLINNDPNVVKEAQEALWGRYNDQEQVDQRNNHLNSALADYYDGMKDAVNTGLQKEITKLQESRQNYVDSLAGDGIGTEQ